MRIDPRTLIGRLTPPSTQLVERAVALAVERGHREVGILHWLSALLEHKGTEAYSALGLLGCPLPVLEEQVRQHLCRIAGAHSGRPVLGERLLQLLEQAWLWASLEGGEDKLRSAAIAYRLVSEPYRFLGERLAPLEQLSAERFCELLNTELRATPEALEAQILRRLSRPASADGQATRQKLNAQDLQKHSAALERYTHNLTEQARQGCIDPIFGRHREVRQMIDVLARRRKNNPILVGEPGVGKTALVEGLALRITQGDVPPAVSEVEVLSLDLGALQAGASARGEFEQRLKSLIDALNGSTPAAIVFIDEVHTLIGAGNTQGGGDAANLLKPMLARGELRTIGATTWSEYKKHIEKDAALSRRFERIHVEEPSESDALDMLRSLRVTYEAAHQVRIRDEALRAAVELSHRYLTGRRLPDKAVDLLDTSAARLRTEQVSRPERLLELDERLSALHAQEELLRRDWAEAPPQTDVSSNDLSIALRNTEAQIARLRAERKSLQKRFAEQKAALEELASARRRLDEAAAMVEEEEPTHTRRTGTQPSNRSNGADSGANRDAGSDTDTDTDTDGNKPSGYAVATRGATAQAAAAQKHAIAQEQVAAQALAQAERRYRECTADETLVQNEVDAHTVARTVSAWTGIPLGKVLRDRNRAVLDLGTHLRSRVIGQDAALAAVERTMRIAQAGIGNPKAPLGVLLFVGPSGVGKTETALALAERLYGGERFLTTINMSEFQEKHSVSRLIGSPPGYVGYGEGGVLTEAVRQKPYSVVLLDECEKADIEVMNLFYQVFDKGTLADGEGRQVDFRNTLIVLTSNLGSQEVFRWWSDQARTASFDHAAQEYPSSSDAELRTLDQAIRPALNAHFQPALLGRMTVVPFVPLDASRLAHVAQLKLATLKQRIARVHRLDTLFSNRFVESLVQRCQATEAGARALDGAIQEGVMNGIATRLLEHFATPAVDRATPGGELRVDLDALGRLEIVLTPGPSTAARSLRAGEPAGDATADGRTTGGVRVAEVPATKVSGAKPTDAIPPSNEVGEVNGG